MTNVLFHPEAQAEYQIEFQDVVIVYGDRARMVFPLQIRGSLHMKQ